MKELFSAFQRELFRPLVTLLIPGLIAILPYIALNRLGLASSLVGAKGDYTISILLVFFRRAFCGNVA